MERTDGDDVVPLTHEQLATLLGVGRSYTSRVIQTFKAEGVLETRRGSILVRNREALQIRACLCNEAVKNHFEEVLRGVYPTEETQPADAALEFSPPSGGIRRRQNRAIVAAMSGAALHAIFDIAGLACGRRCGLGTVAVARSPIFRRSRSNWLTSPRWCSAPDSAPICSASLNLWLSGLPGIARSVEGALAGGIVAIELYKWRNGISLRTGARFALPLAIGIAVGRIGCYFAGLDDFTYGTPTTLPWGHDFGDGIARHPVQLYESAAMAGVRGVLCRWRFSGETVSSSPMASISSLGYLWAAALRLGIPQALRRADRSFDAVSPAVARHPVLCRCHAGDGAPMRECQP